MKETPHTLSVEIRAQPIDETRCRFVVDRPVYPGRWVYFKTPAEASGAPLAERLFALGGCRAF